MRSSSPPDYVLGHSKAELRRLEEQARFFGDLTALVFREAGLREGLYADIAQEVIRPTPTERHDNPRSGSAKLRWARKAG